MSLTSVAVMSLCLLVASCAAGRRLSRVSPVLRDVLGGHSQRRRLKPTGVQALKTNEFLVTCCLHISFHLRDVQSGLKTL